LNDIFTAIPQRRQLDGKHIQPVVKIFSDSEFAPQKAVQKI
jgi:hypothetical protein